ncbi:hypothetical protein GCM10029963_06220 [Micromonospora andamanensis]
MAIGTWFATEFDEPVPARELPAMFSSGGDPEVLLADQMARGVAILGRVQGTSGAVVLKVRTDGRPVRVRVNLHIDGASQNAWSRAAAPARGCANCHAWSWSGPRARTGPPPCSAASEGGCGWWRPTPGWSSTCGPTRWATTAS